MRWFWIALLLLGVSACSQNKPASRGLRVPLPEGWTATPNAAGVLQAGPKGRAVLTLERKTAPLPALETLEAAVEAEGAAVTHAEASAAAVVVRFSRAGNPEALLMARPLTEGVVLLCATTLAAEAPELELGQTLCAGVRLELAP